MPTAAGVRDLCRCKHSRRPRAVPLLLPRNAIQTIDGKLTAFVQVPEGFEARAVQAGAMTEDAVEVIGGLKPGEIVAVLNTFVLKSDSEKQRRTSDDRENPRPFGP
jgi:Membrane-fusion protein